MKTDKEIKEFEAFIIEELKGEGHRIAFLMEDIINYKEIGPLEAAPLEPEEDDLANNWMDTIYRQDKLNKRG